LAGIDQLWYSFRQRRDYLLEDPLVWAACIILLMILTAILFALLR
jgi:hypothetical protein